MPQPLTINAVTERLFSAWCHVQAKASAPGLDGIDIADFAADAGRQLQALEDAVTSGAYAPLPVRIFTIPKGAKVRELGILTVRDRIVQHALAQALSERYEPMLLPASYAFRQGKSAKMAVRQVCAWIEEGNTAVFRSDIEDYFNRIDHSLLLARLAGDCDGAVVDCIQKSIRLPEARGGLTTCRERGLCQGSPLSPVLSNLYLHPLDQAMASGGGAYLRYCDDFVCLGDGPETMRARQQTAQDTLAGLKLNLKQTKNFIGNVADGFSFLGHVFSDRGSIAAVQALESLEDRLLPCLQRLLEAFAADARADDSRPEPDWSEAAAVLRGWRQYYTLPPTAYARAEFAVAALALAAVEEETDGALPLLRDEWLADWADGPYWPLIAELCARLEQPIVAVRLYETWFGWQGPQERDAAGAEILYPLWRAYYATARRVWLVELTQTYTDLGIYAFAGALYQQSVLTYEGEEAPEALASEAQPPEPPPSALQNGEAAPNEEAAPASGHGGESRDAAGAGPLPPTADMAQRVLELFVDEKRYHGREDIRIGQDRAVQHIPQPPAMEAIQAHLRGECAISTSFVDEANSVTCIALDIDILSKWLADPKVDIAEKKREALQVAAALQKRAGQLGLNSLLEDSGQRGFHLWVPIDGAVSAGEAVEMTLLLLAGQPDLTGKGIGIERFPSSKRLRHDQAAKLLRLPCGLHPVTGEWCPFIQPDGTPVRHQVAALQAFQPTGAKHAQAVLRRALSAPKEFVQAEAQTHVVELLPLDAGIELVLSGCAIVRNLCAQARKTGFLRHDERLHLLYVFGHMGEMGRQYLHQVMKWTYNYRYEITQRFIDRILERPIGCNRLREAYEDRPFVAGCNCDFPMVEGTYPSPVLHAMQRDADRGVTLPRRRHVPAEAVVGAETAFQTHDQLLELAEQMLALNKEKNRLEDDIAACQQKLAVLFDRLKVDRFEIGIGTLARERAEDGGYKWKVDIL